MRQIIFTLLFVYGFAGLSQNLPREEVFCHLNATNFIPGELLYFSTYSLFSDSGELSSSSLLYIEIVDSEGQSRIKSKIKLTDGRGHGSLFIPFELETGTYHFIAYTRWMMNFEDRFEQAVLIINPYRKLADSIINSSSQKMSRIVNYQSSVPKKYKPMEKKSAEFDLDAGTYSVSVNRLNDGFFVNDFQKGQPPSPSTDRSTLLYPEDRYGVIQGKVHGPYKEILVSTSFPGKEMEVGMCITDPKGAFVFFYDPENIYDDGFFSMNHSGRPEVELIPEYYSSYPKRNYGVLEIDSLMLQKIQERGIQNQLMNAYKEGGVEIRNDSSQFISAEGTKTYVLNEYKRFDSMRDTFIEIIFEVATSKNETDFELKMRSDPVPGVTKSELRPLSMLDGVIVDSEVILSVNPYSVKRIEVLDQLYFFGSVVFDGLISVHTFKGDFGGQDLDDQKLGITMIQRNDPVTILVDYPENRRSPSYETLLYWDPIIRHKGGKLEFNFQCSESKGLYEIKITGISDDGEFVNRSDLFTIE